MTQKKIFSRSRVTETKSDMSTDELEKIAAAGGDIDTLRAEAESLKTLGG